jgi:hypothetical protein
MINNTSKLQLRRNNDNCSFLDLAARTAGMPSPRALVVSPRHNSFRYPEEAYLNSL